MFFNKQTQTNDGKWICHHCIGEDYLSELIKQSREKVSCSYCDNSDSECISLYHLSELVQVAFEENYQLSENEPQGFYAAMHHDKEVDYDWERKGEDLKSIISERLNSDDPIVNDVIEVWRERVTPLHDPRGDYDDESFFDQEALFVETKFDHRLSKHSWEYIKTEISHKSRYFSKQIPSFFANVFENLDILQSALGPVITTIDETKVIYRGRVSIGWEDTKKLLSNPCEELSAPPHKLARAGRMNAAGISVFYGSLEEQTCLAEVRALVGAEVVVASFYPLRPLRALDLKAMERAYHATSIFDPQYQNHLERLFFLRSLSQKMSEPVMPLDEPLDYVITQAICEYLSNADFKLDGILYPSTQSGGEATNVVLFAKSCQVLPKSNNLSKHAKVSRHAYSYDEGEIESEISIDHSIHCTDNDKVSSENQTHSLQELQVFEYPPTLRLNQRETHVFIIKAVRYEAKQVAIVHTGQ